MPLSSISNGNFAANSSNKPKSEIATEQLAKRSAGPFSDNEMAQLNDNVTLTESVSIANSRKNAGPYQLDSGSAGNLLQQIMRTIMTNSQAAVSAQANLTPQAAQTLLADN